MPILTESKDIKLMCSDHKVAKIYCQNEVIYSPGNIVTYHVSPGVTYQEEVDEGASCLSPKTFTPSLSGWTFVGWRSDASANANVHQSLVMGDNPVVLYAVFRQAVTVTYYNGSTAASSTSGYRYYNSGNIANPSFTLTQAALSGWSARGWSASGAADGGIAYANGVAFTRDSSITLYGMYQQPVTLSYNGNGATGGSVSEQTGIRYYNSNGAVINPTFNVKANAFSYSNYTFVNWALNGVSGTRYAPTASITLSSNATMYAIWIGTPFTWVSNFAGSAYSLTVSRHGWVRNTGIAQTNTTTTSNDLAEVVRRLKNGNDAYQYDACGFTSTLSGARSRKTKYINITYGIYSPAGNGNYNGPGVLYVNANGTRIYTLDLTGTQKINETVKVPLPDSDANIVIGLNGAVDAGMSQTPSGNISSVTFTNS